MWGFKLASKSDVPWFGEWWRYVKSEYKYLYYLIAYFTSALISTWCPTSKQYFILYSDSWSSKKITHKLRKRFAVSQLWFEWKEILTELMLAWVCLRIIDWSLPLPDTVGTSSLTPAKKIWSKASNNLPEVVVSYVMGGVGCAMVRSMQDKTNKCGKKALGAWELGLSPTFNNHSQLLIASSVPN